MWWAGRALIDVRHSLRRSTLLDVSVSPPPVLPVHAERGVRFVLRGRPTTCLQRALVLQRWHAAQGNPREVVIGVAGESSSFSAHAWLDGDVRCGRGFRRAAQAAGAVTGLAPFPLTSLEVACGIVLGPGTSPPEQPGTGPTTPLAAFESAVLDALVRPPCLVSFSGGRDSSAALAVATRVARREGLPLPIPATHRFPSVDRADEVEWQELVVTHLGLDEWYRVEFDDELDCVGPVATDVLRRHGLLWPFNAFFHVPLLQAARGGSLITGIGGDEVFGGSRWARAAAVLSGQSWPRPRDASRIALALAPPRWRGPILRRRVDIRFPWLRPESLRRVQEAWADQDAAEPFGWGKEFSWWKSLRFWQVAERSFDVLAADADARIVHPFADSRVRAGPRPAAR